MWGRLALSLTLSLARCARWTRAATNRYTHTPAELLLPLAPSSLVLREMFKELGAVMSIVPLTPRLLKLLDLSANVSSLLTCKPLSASRAALIAAPLEEEEASDEMQAHEAADRKAGKDRRRQDSQLVLDVAERVFAIETLLFPYALTREWTQEKRNAFRRRLASVRCEPVSPCVRACSWMASRD